MRTYEHTRKTMPKEWIDYFKTFKGKKYFDNMGITYMCCAYKPEHDSRGVVQTALRRSAGRPVFDFPEGKKNKLKELGFDNTSIVNIYFNTCAQMHGGMYIYDLIKMRKEHNCCFEEKWITDSLTKKKRKVKATVKRGVNDYYEVPLEYCTKVYDIWDLPKHLTRQSLYCCAVWQYQNLIRKDDMGNCLYDKINTWEDLPDWCFWKWLLPDGTIIKGREEQFEEFKNRVKNDSRYIPIHSINKTN